MRGAPAVEWTALLGRRDEPTDGVRDYCHWLARALERRGVKLTEAEVPWAEQGWLRALIRLRKQSRAWRRRWVLVQYTELGWSRRGFPFGALAVLGLLRRRGARTAIVFHSAEPQAGNRRVDRLRGACQRWAMRQAARQAARIILPVPLERAGWLGEARSKAAFIPIGANIPAAAAPRGSSESPGKQDSDRRPATVAVFGVDRAPQTEREVEDISRAVRQAKQRLPATAGLPRLRLVVFGRESAEVQPLLERALRGSEVELEALGILPAEEVARTLAKADVFLFVRGELAPNRGSAIAAIACGLPIVGYGSPDSSFPVSQAGVRLVPRERAEELGEALAEVLTNPSLRGELRARSRQASADFFSWERIAERYLEALGRE